MRKIAAFLAAVFCILLFPTAALANSAQPSPYDIDIAVNDFSKVTYIEILLSAGGDEFNTTKTLQYPQETRRQNERAFSFYNEDGKYKSFKLQVIIDGKVQISDAADFADWGDYIYDVANNRLTQGEITSWKLNGYSLLFIPMFLIAPLIVTLFVEWLISLAFRLRPGKYVVIINAITNPVMNILLLVVFNNVMLDYYAILILLELCVAALEFLFYMRKYKEYSKKRLLLFTAVANMASWVVYYLISNEWF